MPGIIDADTHISESEAMWTFLDKDMYHRRPVLLKAPEDTLYGPRNAFWLIVGNIFPKPNGKGSFRLITPSASKLESSRGDIHLAYREMTDIPGRLKDMDKLGVDKRSEEHTSELQSRLHLVCRLLLEKKKKRINTPRLL